jgi:hypothetical protein
MVKGGFKACDWLYMMSYFITKEYEVQIEILGKKRNTLVHDLSVQYMLMGMNYMIIT